MALDKKVSYSGQNKVDTLSSKVRIEEGKGRLVAFDGSNNVGLFGYDDSGQVVVKVAKPGFDANSATDDQLIFNSNQNIFKIIRKYDITADVNWPGLSGPTFGGQYWNGTIEHNLGYTPTFLVYRKNSSGRFIAFNQSSTLAIGQNSNGFTMYRFETEAYANENTIELQIGRPYVLASGSSMPADSFINDIVCYILQESIDVV